MGINVWALAVSASLLPGTEYPRNQSTGNLLEIREVSERSIAKSLKVSTFGVASDLRFSRAYKTSVAFGKKIKTASSGAVLTFDQSVYRPDLRIGLLIQEPESTYDGDIAAEPAVQKLYQGVKPSFVTEVNYRRSPTADMCYLGVWRLGEVSIVGAFDLQDGILSEVRPLLHSRRPVIAIDRGMTIHGPEDPITIVRRMSQGPAEVITMSINIKKAFPDVSYC